MMMMGRGRRVWVFGRGGGGVLSMDDAGWWRVCRDPRRPLRARMTRPPPPKLPGEVDVGGRARQGRMNSLQQPHEGRLRGLAAPGVRAGACHVEGLEKADKLWPAEARSNSPLSVRNERGGAGGGAPRGRSSMPLMIGWIPRIATHPKRERGRAAVASPARPSIACRAWVSGACGCARRARRGRGLPRGSHGSGRPPTRGARRRRRAAPPGGAPWPTRRRSAPSLRRGS